MSLIAHEFIIIELFDGRKLLPLIIERLRSTQKAKAPNTWLKFAASACVTDDRISRVPADFMPSNFDIIVTSICPSEPILRLPDICTIFETIALMAPNYLLLKNQCYWFCSMFLECVEEKLKMVKKEGKEFKYGGKFANVEVVKDGQAKHDIEAHKENLRRESEMAQSQEKSDITRAFQVAVAKQRQKVTETRTNARDAVQPLLLTSQARTTSEEVMLTSMISKVLAGARRQVEQGEK